MDLVRKRLARVKKKPLVYVESYADFHTAGPGSGGNDMCVFAGGQNLAGDFSMPYSEVTSEWVVSRQPGVIFKTTAWGNGFEKETGDFLNSVKAKIISRPSWDLIPAVANDRVYVLDSGIWTGPRAIIGVMYMAKWIFPDIFHDIDPEQIHREYFELFQKIPYQGVYVSGKF
jgi:iron complex transport system substrate-binding protein